MGRSHAAVDGLLAPVGPAATAAAIASAAPAARIPWPPPGSGVTSSIGLGGRTVGLSLAQPVTQPVAAPAAAPQTAVSGSGGSGTGRAEAAAAAADDQSARLLQVPPVGSFAEA